MESSANGAEASNIRGWTIEALKRGVQLVVAFPLFDLPLLLSVRHLALRQLFSVGSDILVGNNHLFVQPHGFYGGVLQIGNHVKIHRSVEIDYTGDVIVGDDVWISQGVLIETHDHVPTPGKPKSDWAIVKSPLRIGSGSWIGARVIILESAGSIGENSIVAAGSVVTKDVPANTIVAGVPAKFVRPFDAECRASEDSMSSLK